MDSFSGSVFGERCYFGKKSSDVFNDYLDVKKGVQLSKPSWHLHKLATIEEYQDWERHMEWGFRRCRKYNGKFSGYDGYGLAYRRVDTKVTRWWCKAVGRGDFDCTSEDFKKILRDGFVLPYMEEIEQPPKVVHGIEDICKSIAPILKVTTVVTTHEKLTVVSLPTVSKVAAMISELSVVDVVKDVVEEVVPLSGLNMQLKRVHDETCMTADRGQRWNLFRAQCIIKGKACKLMIFFAGKVDD
jgi:hypothetical protein